MLRHEASVRELFYRSCTLIDPSYLRMAVELDIPGTVQGLQGQNQTHNILEFEN